MPRAPAHGKDWNFAVCLDPGTRRSLNFCRVPQILAHGEVGSRRHHPPAVTVPAPAPPSVPLICRVPPLAHGKHLCRVPDKRHTAKWALPSRLVAVERSPWAVHGEPIRRVLCGLRHVPWAHGNWPESGSEWFIYSQRSHVSLSLEEFHMSPIIKSHNN